MSRTPTSPVHPISRVRRGDTVCIVEDHLLLAESLQMALCLRGVDARVVTAADLSALLDDLLARQPRVVLLDLDLGAIGDSTGLIAPLAAAGIRVVVVTGTTDPMRIAAALELGAIGFRSKTASFDALLDTACRALTTDGWLDQATATGLLVELGRTRADHARRLAPFSRLTARECSVLRALAAGQSVRQIAASWVVSEATVRSHVRAILAELGVSSQLAAVAAAHASGWLADQVA